MGPTMGDAHVPVPMGKKKKFYKFGRMAGKPLSNAERLQRVEAAKSRWRGHVALATGTGSLAGALGAQKAGMQSSPDRQAIDRARRWGVAGGAIGGSIGALAGGAVGGGVASLATGLAGSAAGDVIGRQFFERLAYAGSANGGAQMAQRFFGGLPDDEEQSLGHLASSSTGNVLGSSLGRKLALAGRFTGTRGRLLFDSIGSAAGEYAGDALGRKYFGKSEGPVNFDATITKIDEEERIVYGFASVSENEGGLVTDRQGDQIETKEMVRAAHDFIRKRQGKVMHAGKCVGEVVESLVLRPELQKALGIDIKKIPWIIGYKVQDEDAWNDVKKGKFKGFSIGGKGKRKQVDG